MFQLFGTLFLIIVVIPCMFVASTVVLIFEGLHAKSKRRR